MSPKLLYRSKMPHPDDPDIVESIVDSLELGMSQPAAAALAGIHEDTLYHWRYQGEAELAALQGRHVPWEELGSKAKLVIRIKQARAGVMKRALQGWWANTDRDWAKYATMLERLFPADFARRTNVQVETQHTVQLELAAPAEQELLRIVAQRLALPSPQDAE